MSGATGYFITAGEAALLFGLPWLSQVLYLQLRQRMNFNTGWVGVEPLISWRALAEGCYVEPHPGMPSSGTPSEQQVRRAAVHLAKAGLIRMRSDALQWHLRIFLPLSHRGVFLSPIRPTGKPTGQLHREKPAKPTGKPTSTSELLSYNHPPITHSGLARRSASVDNLIVSPSVPAGDRETIKALLRRSPTVNGQAQAILDELAGAIAKGAVRNGPGYVRTLIRKAEAGDFVPARGLAIAGERARAQRTATRQGADTSALPIAEQRARMKALRESRKGRP